LPFVGSKRCDHVVSVHIAILPPRSFMVKRDPALSEAMNPDGGSNEPKRGEQ
jgi:hypothetical protein